MPILSLLPAGGCASRAKSAFTAAPFHVLVDVVVDVGLVVDVAVVGVFVVVCLFFDSYLCDVVSIRTTPVIASPGFGPAN